MIVICGLGVRNPETFNNGETYICEVSTNGSEFHKFHASPKDPERHGRMIYEAISLGLLGDVKVIEPPRPKVDAESVKRNRALAYSDPINGSDALYIKAYRLSLCGDPAAQDAISKANERYEAIKKSMPYPME